MNTMDLSEVVTMADAGDGIPDQTDQQREN
jgi:hypothetical protein